MYRDISVIKFVFDG